MNTFDKQVGFADTMLSDLVKIWFDYIKERYAKKTKQQYEYVLSSFLATLPPNLSKSQITPFHIENYIKYLLKLKLTNRSCNLYLIAIRSFFHWAKDHYQIENPTKYVSNLAEQPPKSRCLSEEEYQKVLNATTDLENAALQFLANTGLRRNEFRFLQWSNFSSDFINVLGKGNKQRYVPLNNICKQLVSKYPQNGENQPVFISAFQCQESLYLLGQRLAKKLHIPPFGPHALRHFFATRLIRAGVPLIKVSKLLGHSSVVITEQIYVHLVPMDFSGVTDCLKF